MHQDLGSRRREALVLATLAVVGAVPATTLAVDGTWNTNATGLWTDVSKWSSNPTAPGGVGTTNSTDIATIGSVVNGKTITVDAGRNVAGIQFNANAGAVTLSGGSLYLSGGGAIQVTGAGAGTVTVSSPITLGGDYAFTSNSSVLSRYLKINGTVAGTATTGQTQTLTLNGSNYNPSGVTEHVVAGKISDGGAGKLAIVKEGAGSWSLGVANDFTGGVTLREGMLVMQNAAALGTGTFTIEGGTLRGTSGYTITNAAVFNGDWSYGSNSTFTLNGPTVSLGAAAGTTRSLDVSGGTSSVVTINPAISSGTTASKLRKTGAGTLNLANNSNAFTNLEVNGGTVVASTVVGGTGSSYASPVSLGTPFGTGTITLNGGGVRASVSGGGPSGADHFYGTLANDIDLAGAGTISNHSSARSWAIYTGTISGSGKLTVSQGNQSTQDPSGIILQHTNTHTGGTEITSHSGATSARGVLILDAVNALGGGAGGTGGAVTVRDLSYVANPFTAPNYTVLKYDQTVAGLASPRSRTFVTGYSTTDKPSLTINNTTGGAGDNSDYVGVIGGGLAPPVAGVTAGYAAGNNIELVKEGTGTQVLSGLNLYAGGTVVNGGTLVIDGGATQAAGARTGTLTSSSAIVTSVDTTGLQVGMFVFGTGATTSTPSIVSIDAANNRFLLSSTVATGSAASLSFSGLGSAAGKVVTTSGSTASGTPNVTLSSVAGLAVGQYVSATNVNSQSQIVAIDTVNNIITLNSSTTGTISSGASFTFLATSGTGAGDVVVNAGTLAGRGGIVGDVILNAGGHISPGNSVGTLSTGDLSFNAAAFYDAELDFIGESSTGTADRINVTGTVSLGGSQLKLSFLNVGDTLEKTFVLLTNDGTDAINGVFTVNLPPAFAGLPYDIFYDYNADGGSVGNDVAITFVPEPASVAALALGLGAVLRRRRTRA